jgi:putative ABC transport system permease protein
VANTVLMNVYERFAEFGIMRAMGAKQGFVFRLVLLESLMLAVVGGVFGSLGAYLASIGMNAYTIAQIGIPLSAVTPRLVLFAFLVSLALGVLSGLLPARTASKIPVVEALGRV